ncbi:polymer-forming cytoskeletal protein [Kineothrix sedimenti]|uniref:Polymer-forming cytoskeletal protein n=1 Tax=Kineothrix sedimenti TaxID=3123317 RepID=A0ABZ3F3E1_9FIRM
MLGKKTTEHLNAKISSVIGADMVMEGNITAKETIRIEGTVKGDVSSEGILIVSSSGKVIGNVKGSSIMVSGTIQGDMDSNGRIEVSATGRINGNIKTKSLIIDENAVFQGQCTMNTQENVLKAAEYKAGAAKEDTAEKK